jgi:hypothetical protein
MCEWGGGGVQGGPEPARIQIEIEIVPCIILGSLSQNISGF